MTDKEFIGFLNNLEDKNQHVCKINICNFKPYDPKAEIERIDVTVADMIDLINRQQEELEKLNVELVGMRGACNSYKTHYDNAQTEIKRLERELDIALENDPSKIYPYEVTTPYGVVFSKCEKGYGDFKMDIKSEAIKEYKEKLISEIVNTPTKKYDCGVFYLDGVANREHEIIEIIKGCEVKEMVGEQE